MTALEFGAALALGFSAAGVFLGVSHATTFLRSTGAKIYMPRRDSADWRYTLLCLVVFLCAALLSWALLLRPDAPSTQALAALLAVSLAELQVATLSPAIGLTGWIARHLFRDAERRDAPADPPERARERGLRARLRRLAAKPEGRTDRQWREELLLRGALALALLALPLGFALPWGAALPGKIAAGFAAVCATAAALFCALRYWNEALEAQSGYVPRQVARDRPEFQLPEAQHSGRSNPGRYRSDRLIRALDALLLYVLQLALLIAILYRAIPIDHAAPPPGLPPALHSWILTIVALILVFTTLARHQRRMIGIWEDVGLVNANRVSMSFMKEVGHQMKNMILPVDYGLARAEETLALDAQARASDPDRERFVQRRTQAAREGVIRIRDWLETLRKESRALDDRRRSWLTPERDRWVNLAEILERWAEEALLARSNLRARQAEGREDKTPREARIRLHLRGQIPAFDMELRLRDMDREERLRAATTAGSESLDSFEIRLDPESVSDILHNISRNALQAAQDVGQPMQKASSVEAAKADIHDPAVDLFLVVDLDSRFPVTFSVRDNGPGIPEATRDTLFEPSITTKSDGMGMGLFMAREYLHAISGRIRFTTSTQRALSFSLFTVEIPAARLRSRPKPRRGRTPQGARDLDRTGPTQQL